MSNPRSNYSDSISFFGKTTPQELAERFGTPLYVYNENLLRKRCQELKALSDYSGYKVNYSAKANTNLSLLNIIKEEKCVVDAMSPGELFINLKAGFSKSQILYVCNNVSREELENAVQNNVLVSVDSLSQIDLYGKINPGGQIMVRFNPGIGAGHHQKVITAGKETKFGVNPKDLDEVLALLQKHNLKLTGINQHIGSLFMRADEYIAAAELLLSLAQNLPQNIFKQLEIIDFGGGFGIPYHKYENQERLNLHELSQLLDSLIKNWSKTNNYLGQFFVEPGRYIVAECGILLGEVHVTKNNDDTLYVGTDIGFNVLVRPAMYDSHHDIEVYRLNAQPDNNLIPQTIVGNICESGDILAKKRPLPLIKEGDILGILDAGAYGYVMSFTYNQRLRPAEVLINSQGQARCIRRRETIQDLLAGYDNI